MTTNLIYSDISSIGINASEPALRFVLNTLSEGKDPSHEHKCIAGSGGKLRALSQTRESQT